MCGYSTVLVWRIMGVSTCNQQELHLARMNTYGPSVQVKTWPKPHERTSLSASLRDFAMFPVQRIVHMKHDAHLQEAMTFAGP
jgi:hypothetical protein